MNYDNLRIGIDLGGTKIAGIALSAKNTVLASLQTTTPREDYHGTIKRIVEVVERLEQKTGRAATVGVGMPGSISPTTGRVQNANSTWLNDRPFAQNLESALERPVKLANDANCFALSEAADGAAADSRSTFGVILGTGCGGAFVHLGRLLNGPRGIAGEWGHVPLPWANANELPGPKCWCGRRGCIETWISGPGLAKDHQRSGGNPLSAEEIVARAGQGDQTASATLARHANRLARGLGAVINILDPEVVVLGGGLSDLHYLYEVLPELIAPHIFADCNLVVIRRPLWGATSGVRGAARLWDVS